MTRFEFVNLVRACQLGRLTVDDTNMSMVLDVLKHQAYNDGQGHSLAGGIKPGDVVIVQDSVRLVVRVGEMVLGNVAPMLRLVGQLDEERVVESKVVGLMQFHCEKCGEQL